MNSEIMINEIKELSKKFVNENIVNPSPEDYLVFENAMLEAATYITKQLIKSEKSFSF